MKHFHCQVLFLPLFFLLVSSTVEHIERPLPIFGAVAPLEVPGVPTFFLLSASVKCIERPLIFIEGAVTLD